eukprot:TRINITY_DN4492_c0_g1_i1.p1 TRINITY_DN4492_c0_g1~~TRINITY_DN4492_c0_g1_i1.p1  ORF type:complete len:1201 (+),score=424.78 TRINITY_DN4492_c0_g1_i1:147-3605(+)
MSVSEKALMLGEMMDSIAKLRDMSGKVTLRDKLTILNRFQEIFVATLPPLAERPKKSTPEPTSGYFFAEDGVDLGSFMRAMFCCIVSPSSSIRRMTLRILRIYSNDHEFVSAIMEYKLHYFIMQALEKIKAASPERLEALKLARKMVLSDADSIHRSVAQSIIAIAEHREDPYSRVALELLLSLAVRNPKVVAECNGMKTIFNAVIDLVPFNEGVQEALLAGILYLLGDLNTRRYVRPDELYLVVSPLIDLNPKPNVEQVRPKWEAAQHAIVYILTSWTGAYAMASCPMGLEALVSALCLPSIDLNDIVLETIFMIFRIAIPKTGADPFGRQSSSAKSQQSLSFQDSPSLTLFFRHNLLDNFLALLLIAFMKADLFETLIDLNTRMKQENEDDSETTKRFKKRMALKSTILIGELLHFSNMLLPTSHCARLQTLPSLVRHAVSFNLDPRVRSLYGTMVSNLHTYSHIKGTASSSAKGMDHRLDRIEEIKMKLDWKMDASVLNEKLKESNVLAFKDDSRWNWDIIGELVSGPLHNPAHLTVALRTKFFKRLLSFLRPNNHLFSGLSYNDQHMRYSRIACQVLEMLVENSEGQKLLYENKFIPQLAAMLQQETQPNSKATQPSLLSKQNVLKLMAREYFTMIGKLTSTKSGLHLLNKFKVFDYLGPMSVMPGRDDLCHLIMTSLDYNIAGPSRILLAKSLLAKSKVVRYLAAKQMRVLLRANVSGFHEWGVHLLVKQLADTDSKVALVALSVLDEAADDSACLDSIIKKGCFEQLVNFPEMSEVKHPEKGNNLLMRFLSRSSGFKYLSTTTYIETELKEWRQRKFIDYVKIVETPLMEAFAAPVWRRNFENRTVVNLPVHFYGELVRTSDGCAILKESGHFDEFVDMIKSPYPSMLTKRGALWVLGHIGKSKKGLKYLENDNVVQLIVEMACSSPSLPIKGTCFMVLGLLRRTKQGERILRSLNWDYPPESHKYVAVPENILDSRMFDPPAWPVEGSWARNSPPTVFEELEDPVERDILKFAVNLSNHITTDKALVNLKSLREKHAGHFKRTRVFKQVLALLTSYKLRLPVRRFMFQLFDGIALDESTYDLDESDRVVSRMGIQPPGTRPQPPAGRTSVRPPSATFSEKSRLKPVSMGTTRSSRSASAAITPGE